MSEKESLFSEERKQKILDMIKHNEKVTVAQLCKHFNMSGATIRNDLRELENCGLLKRTHGGAIANTKSGFEPITKEKEQESVGEKQSIARAALELIEDGDIIILDTGTTTLELARQLGARRNLTVITNDLQIALWLEEIHDAAILFIGGFVKKQFHCTVGLTGSDMLSGLNADKAFMGTNGLTVTKGATTPDISQGEMKRAMTSIANKVILLCDSNKVGRKSFYQFASIEEIDTIVTDGSIEPLLKEELDAEGLEIIIA